MQRYFINEDLTNCDILKLSDDDCHHIQKVMRNKNGDMIGCIDINGVVYHGEISDITKGLVKIIEKTNENNELDIDVTLIYALPKGDKLELVLQKATELGVRRVVPLLTRRCVVKTDKNKFSKKLARYQKILLEAAKQSCRNVIPEIVNVIKLDEISQYLGDHNIVAYEELSRAGESLRLKKTMMSLKPGDSLTIVVGSEGGFDQDEIDIMTKTGIKPCSLGKRILRSETAPLYLLSVIGYSREMG